LIEQAHFRPAGFELLGKALGLNVIQDAHAIGFPDVLADCI
jgi:hypothetical protein